MLQRIVRFGICMLPTGPKLELQFFFFFWGGGYTNTRLRYAQQISFKINLILKEIRWEEHSSMNAPNTLVHFSLKTFSLIRCNTV